VKILDLKFNNAKCREGGAKKKKKIRRGRGRDLILINRNLINNNKKIVKNPTH
jgi:hypothetical protein